VLDWAGLGWVGSDHDGRLASWRCHATIREGEGVGRELARRLGIAKMVEKRVGDRGEARRGEARHVKIPMVGLDFWTLAGSIRRIKGNRKAENLSASASGFRGRERGIFSAAHCRAEAVCVCACACACCAWRPTTRSFSYSLSKPQASDVRIRFEGFRRIWRICWNAF
jgi:hypothetical protein